MKVICFHFMFNPSYESNLFVSFFCSPWFFQSKKRKRKEKEEKPKPQEHFDAIFFNNSKQEKNKKWNYSQNISWTAKVEMRSPGLLAFQASTFD